MPRLPLIPVCRQQEHALRRHIRQLTADNPANPVLQGMRNQLAAMVRFRQLVKLLPMKRLK